MKKLYPTIRPLIKTLMVSSCALMSFAASPGWAQSMDSQSYGSMYQQGGAQSMNSQDMAANYRRSGAGAGATVNPASMQGGSALPVITNTQPNMGNYQGRANSFPGNPAGANFNANFGQNFGPNTNQNPALHSVKGAFESYVGMATGANLDIFGKDLFYNVPDTFAPLDRAQVNPDYVIGSGDELQIRGWGMVDIDLSAKVDRSGAIYIPHVGSIKVAGVKYRDLQDYLKKAVGKIFNNFDLTVSVSQTRAVQVYVVGHAVRPGTYTLSAMSTLLNALFTSGGPDNSGSMRNIQVKRGAVTVTTFDLYDMLIKGDKSQDIPLQDGDVIYIPQVGPLVALTGNVKKPAIFELKGPSSVADIIKWAGGFDAASNLKEVVVEKSVDNNYQTVAELIADRQEIENRLASIPLHPADILRVFAPSAVPVPVQVRNEYVRVGGEVKHSGVFRIRKGETLRELIARLGGVTDNAYLYATRFNRESVRIAQQAQLDEVANRFERDLETNATQRLASTTDKDAVANITAEVARERALAQKMHEIKAQGRIVLELPGGDAQVKNLPDLALHDGDSIYIPRKPGTVDVLGAVFQQNSFIYRPNRSVNDYLALAGGATVSADKSEIYLIRADGTTESTRNSSWFSGVGSVEVNPGDTVVVPEELNRGSLTQSFKEWTAIFYQFGLGAAGLKVLQD